MAKVDEPRETAMWSVFFLSDCLFSTHTVLQSLNFTLRIVISDWIFDIYWCEAAAASSTCEQAIREVLGWLLISSSKKCVFPNFFSLFTRHGTQKSERRLVRDILSLSDQPHIDTSIKFNFFSTRIVKVEKIGASEEEEKKCFKIQRLKLPNAVRQATKACSDWHNSTQKTLCNKKRKRFINRRKLRNETKKKKEEKETVKISYSTSRRYQISEEMMMMFYAQPLDDVDHSSGCYCY